MCMRVVHSACCEGVRARGAFCVRRGCACAWCILRAHGASVRVSVWCDCTCPSRGGVHLPVCAHVCVLGCGYPLFELPLPFVIKNSAALLEIVVAHWADLCLVIGWQAVEVEHDRTSPTEPLVVRSGFPTSLTQEVPVPLVVVPGFELLRNAQVRGPDTRGGAGQGR